MKRRVYGFALVFAMAILSKPAVPQSEAGSQDLKHMLAGVPERNTRMRLTALSIDKEWATSIVHLKGKVKIEILTGKPPGDATVLRADEADYHEKTGEISPRGNVQLTVEDVK